MKPLEVCALRTGLASKVTKTPKLTCCNHRRSAIWRSFNRIVPLHVNVFLQGFCSIYVAAGYSLKLGGLICVVALALQASPDEWYALGVRLSAESKPVEA